MAIPNYTKEELTVKLADRGNCSMHEAIANALNLEHPEQYGELTPDRVWCQQEPEPY